MTTGGTADKLNNLELIRDKAKLEGTCYFEFHPRELPAKTACWLDGSVFISDAGFDFFVRCFERASPNFDYFSFVRFGRSEIERLLSELSEFCTALTPGCSRELLFSRGHFTAESWSGVETESLRLALVAAASGIRDFVQTATKETGCLWVPGM